VAAGGSAVAQIEAASHARAGVNCMGCHTGAAASASPGAWVAKPGERECAACHEREVGGFFLGRHGMRLGVGLTPMTPALARRPMKPSAGDRQLSCSSCHTAHTFDTQQAAVEACLGCHDDGHSRAFEGSPHAALWTRERAGTAPPGSGVSCATCHLPRVPVRETPGTVVVQHNQNLNLRPNEKMTRTVCLACHGLGFSLDALADPRLIASNFTGRPRHRIASIDMAARRAGRTVAH
jgi:formate-dependent nitrite reductase cytochrome c552 subunit